MIASLGLASCLRALSLFCVLALVLASPFFSQARAAGPAPLGYPRPQSCPPLRIELSIDQRPAQVDQSHSYAEFAAHSSVYFANARAAGKRRDDERSGLTLGLYSSNRKAPSEFSLAYTARPDGQTAICLASITIRYSVEPVIYLAREIPPGPCLDSVYQHELGHLQIDHSAALQARQSLAQWGSSVHNHLISRPSEATAVAQELLNAILNRSYSHLFDAQTAGHHRHDGIGGPRPLDSSCDAFMRQTGLFASPR